MQVSKADLRKLADAGITPPDLRGLWVNELKSRMHVETFNGKAFTGTYESLDSANKWVTGALTGTLSGDTIGFVVDWAPKYPSVTSWAGKLSVDVDQNVYIHTLWLLASGDEELPLWQSISAGADFFWRDDS